MKECWNCQDTIDATETASEGELNVLAKMGRVMEMIGETMRAEGNCSPLEFICMPALLIATRKEQL